MSSRETRMRGCKSRRDSERAPLLCGGESGHLISVSNELRESDACSEGPRGISPGEVKSGRTIRACPAALRWGFCISAFLFSTLHENFERTGFRFDPIQYRSSLKDVDGLLLLCVESAVLNIAVVPFDALLAPIAADIYHSDARMVSVLSISVTIGIMGGAFCYSRLHNKFYQQSF